MKVVNLPSRITPVHFRERAKQYRLAAAVAEAPRDVAMFSDLARIFDKLAQNWTGSDVIKVAANRSLDSSVR